MRRRRRPAATDRASGREKNSAETIRSPARGVASRSGRRTHVRRARGEWLQACTQPHEAWGARTGAAFNEPPRSRRATRTVGRSSAIYLAGATRHVRRRCARLPAVLPIGLGIRASRSEPSGSVRSRGSSFRVGRDDRVSRASHGRVLSWLPRTLTRLRPD